MHNRRDYAPHFTIETIESVDKNGSPLIRTTENAGNHFRSSLETPARNRSFSPLSPAMPTYDYHSLPRLSDAEQISPSGSLRKIVTISRRESPSHTSAFSRPHHWNSSSDTMYSNNSNHLNNTDSKYYRGYSTNDHSSIADPVYKTTMVTQVKPPKEHDGTNAFFRSYNDQPYMKFSVKQPQQLHPQQQQIKLNYFPESDRATSFQLESHKQPTPYSTQLLSSQSTHPADKQYVISSYRPPPELHSNINRVLPQSSFQARPSDQSIIIKQVDNYNNNRNYNNNNCFYTRTNNNTNVLYNNNVNINSRFDNKNSNNTVTSTIINTSNDINKSNIKYSNSNIDSKHSSNNNLSKEAEVDVLTNLLVENMRLSAQPDFYGMCVKCSRSIMGSNNGCTILNHTYHISCFLCSSCSISLAGQSFFCLDGDPLCEPCYVRSVDKCCVCQEPIIDRLIKAVGKSYHVGCFRCCECDQALDGCPFTADATASVYCLSDHIKKHAMRCESCGQAITSCPGQQEVLSVSFNAANYHVDCFKCQDCHTRLSLASKGNGCFCLDAAMLCKNCHVRRVQKITNKASTEL